MRYWVLIPLQTETMEYGFSETTNPEITNQSGLVEGVEFVPYSHRRSASFVLG